MLVALTLGVPCPERSHLIPLLRPLRQATTKDASVRPHVLIIDPVSADRTLFSALLHIAGYTTTACAMLTDARPTLENQPPQAVLAALTIGSDTPRALAAQIRQWLVRPSRIVAISTDGGAHRSGLPGFDGCLIKPVYREQLIAAVEGLPDPFR